MACNVFNLPNRLKGVVFIINKSAINDRPFSRDSIWKDGTFIPKISFVIFRLKTYNHFSL